ncbi:winged helix-turn-helix domain-containing protein [Streptomyces griseorubiginosus]|uniref:ArsR/SmtB family transcription factor n=1 Tax=Streptomyces griseorubiginosus TaxID=67304 RepID=UPI002E81ACAB|nr:winged helix-turn-helix domain-containing protein [Streptomyces griseorubiginosus]WUB46327.1 winged helix-turn-helix domain-containing protein [Streptomyces griseorubiginosus]WUB54848.1 winged helix-turn-helix domain-containing protein [Streptomyces griseorubiginosus]
MGWWQVDGDTLVRSRFVVCPFTETFAALRLLNTGTGAHPGEDAWLRAHLPAYRARLAADPVTALLVRSGMGTSWIADFLAPLPRDGTPLEDTLARIRATDPAVARADVRVSLRGPLPAALERDDLPERAAALLAHVWTATVRPYWDRRRRILEADVVARTAQVSQGGWAAVIDSLLPGQTRWLGGNRLQVNRHERPPRDIRGAELVFVPVTAGRGWATWEEPRRYALVYGCTGALADPGARSVPESLGTLLGAGRARVLVLLDAPLSTSQLVAVTGQALGSVGRHLRVLLDAGLVERRRAGRSVLYVRTAAGEVLVEASGAARVVAGPSGAVGAGAGDSPGGVRLRS